MKERPILFSAPMVRAILEGRKTQTRRAVNMRHVSFIGGSGDDESDPLNWGFSDQYGCWHVLGQSAEPWFGDGITNGSYRIASPYGAPGDRLWVKETWASTEQIGCHRFDAEIVYRADGDPWSETYEGWRWKPSIFMPRWASRITLEIVSVRVERLQDISEEDAIAEGVERSFEFCNSRWRNYEIADDAWLGSPVDSYQTLWKSINGQGSWGANPWVWVVEFRRIES